MSGKITVALETRRARITDAADIAAFHLRVWRASYLDFVPDTIVKKLDYQNRLAYWTTKLGIVNPRQHTLLVLDNTILTGFICFGPPTDPAFGTPSGSKAEIKHLFIDLHHQGQGLGRRLLLAAFEQLANDGFETTGLAVTKDNTSAIAFYHALGGTITGQHTNAGPIWKSQDLIMSWDLPLPSNKCDPVVSRALTP
ncbi:MAG: GNAT family N-acetyltransferase [Rhodobacterales bacterium]|nr:GNAT family N-acetyltransferase [Rhodobacterales bacterium]